MFTFDNKKFKNMIFNQVKHLYNNVAKNNIEKLIKLKYS